MSPRELRDRQPNVDYVRRSELVNWLDDRIHEHTHYQGDYAMKRERSAYVTCRAYVLQMELHQ
jgi:hypothetical protein